MTDEQYKERLTEMFRYNIKLVNDQFDSLPNFFGDGVSIGEDGIYVYDAVLSDHTHIETWDEIIKWNKLQDERSREDLADRLEFAAKEIRKGSQ